MLKPLRIVADENIPLVRETFAHLGEVICLPGRTLSNEQLEEVDILLVRSVTAVNRALLENTAVRYVGSATIGVDHIDTAYLAEQDICWSAAPGSNAESVVDYVMSAFCRLDGVLEQLLHGATVGIVGMGNVGSRLYRRLQKLGVHCIGYDPLIAQNAYPVLVGIDEVLTADIICLHTPLTHTGPYPTFHLLDQQRLEKLKPGTVLLNAGRGAAVDGVALYQLLTRRDDLCVVLDVWENEPDIAIPLLERLDLATPHIAGYSYDGKLAGTAMIYRDCCAFLQISAERVIRAPEVADPIELCGLHDVSHIVRRAVLSAYDIAVDDQCLRSALLHGTENVGESFDRLRKQYPQRREFSCYRVGNAKALPAQARRWLEGLGFILG